MEAEPLLAHDPLHVLGEHRDATPPDIVDPIAAARFTRRTAWSRPEPASPPWALR
jgi:hypothetical protein